jgi:hypothetical protein
MGTGEEKDRGEQGDVSKGISRAPGTDESTEKIEESLAELEEQTDDGKTDLTEKF